MYYIYTNEYIVMERIRTMNTTTNANVIYVSLDTTEGKGCVGHWIWECALFLPYIKDIQNKTSTPLKILLNGKKRYKTNMLSDFGFCEDDIVYSTKMAKDGNTMQEYYVIPEEDEYMLYTPKFFYLWTVFVHTTDFFEAFERFRNFYLSKLEPITKTTPIVYLSRSRLENYIPGGIHPFVNFNDFYNMIEKRGIDILNIDTLSSFVPQFQKVLDSKTIIVEMGSAFTINAAFIASNSHIIVINDTYGYNTCKYSFFHVLRKLVSLRNNTIEIFSTSPGGGPFNIDIPKFEKFIDKIRS
jgi:hypothetical protein